jgi:hypothetical protein
MPGRNRSSVATRYKGAYKRFGIYWYPSFTQTFGAFNNCDDVVGPGDNAPFLMTRADFQGGVIDRPDTGYFSPTFESYVADVLGNSNEFPHIGVSGAPNDVAAATAGAAATNPSRPYVDIPVNILELGDITRLLQRQGQGLARLGRENLRYQFGIRPLVGDLTKLLYFSDQVERRVQELTRLRSSHGLRRTTGVFSGAATDSISRVIQSDGIYVVGTFGGTTTQNVRVHCRWLPDDVGALSAPGAMRGLARRAVLGLTLDHSTLWEAMPWSWLIDWASTIGTFFRANRNIVGATLSDVSVMRHTRTEYSWGGWTDGVARITPITAVREAKQRATSFVAPTAHFPFLSGNQMGILASLAITRS